MHANCHSQARRRRLSSCSADFMSRPVPQQPEPELHPDGLSEPAPLPAPLPDPPPTNPFPQPEPLEPPGSTAKRSPQTKANK